MATSTTITVRPVVHSLGPAWSERQSNARQHTMSSATIVTAPQAVRLTLKKYDCIVDLQEKDYTDYVIMNIWSAVPINLIKLQIQVLQILL